MTFFFNFIYYVVIFFRVRDEKICDLKKREKGKWFVPCSVDIVDIATMRLILLMMTTICPASPTKAPSLD